jgi:hypothetical protein
MAPLKADPTACERSARYRASGRALSIVIRDRKALRALDALCKKPPRTITEAIAYALRTTHQREP